MKRQLQTKPERANSSRDASPHTSTESSNDEWIRGEVADAARILQERNLAHANAIAAPVSPANGIYVRYMKRTWISRYLVSPFLLPSLST